MIPASMKRSRVAVLALLAGLGVLPGLSPGGRAEPEVQSEVPFADPFEAGETELLFPFFQGGGALFSGYAVTNFSDETAHLSVEARGRSGELLPFSVNPSERLIPLGSQLAEVGSELFGVDPFFVQDGWIRMVSGTSRVAGFFQFGDVFNKLDGGVAWTQAAEELHFTRIYHGAQTFPALTGFREAATFLSIANPHLTPVEVTLTLHVGLGTLEVRRTIPPLGMIHETVTDLFSSTLPLGDGFIAVRAEPPGVTGFQLIELSDTVMGLNASLPTDETVSFSAQLAHGVLDGSSFFTSVKLVNVSDELRAVTLIAIADDGSEIRRLPNLVLAPNQTFQRDAGEIFALGPGNGPPVVGSIRVESTGPGIVGDVIFGDRQEARFAAALPLQARPFTRALFSQVANGSHPPGGPALTYFTGLALFNPNPQAAQATIQVFDRDGAPVGERSLQLEAGARTSRVLPELVPESAGLLRGYIVVESTRPLVAQQLFGNSALTFLSAVPPEILQ